MSGKEMHSPRTGLERLDSKTLRVQQEYKWVNGRPTSAKDHTTRHDLARRMAQTVNDTAQSGDRKLGRRREKQDSSLEMDFLKVRRQRLPQGDLRSSRNTRNVKGSFNALHSQTGLLGKTRRQQTFTCPKTQTASR